MENTFNLDPTPTEETKTLSPPISYKYKPRTNWLTDNTQYECIKCSQVDNVERDTYQSIDVMVERFLQAGEMRKEQAKRDLNGQIAKQNENPLTKFMERELSILQENIQYEETITENIRHMSEMDLMDAMRISEKRKKMAESEGDRIYKEIQAIERELSIRNERKKTLKKKKENSKE